MKKVILNLAVSLDGFIEGPNGEIDWCIMDDDMHFDTFLKSIDTIFYGRVSYDAWENYKPDENAAEAEKVLLKEQRSKHKFVFSHQDKTDEKATYITTDLVNRVEEIKRRGGKDIWLYGGANLISTFIKSGLIDRYQISVHPIVLGSGKPLFEGLENRMGLTLKGSRAFRSGVVELTYEPVREMKA